MKIKDITDRGITLYLLVKKIEEKSTKTGKPYVVLDLADGTDEVQAKLWDTTESMVASLIGTVILATVAVDSYGHTVKTYRPSKEGEVDISDYIPTSPIKPTLLYENIMKIIANIKNTDIRRLTEELYTSHREELLKSSAAKMVHHNTIGGLLWHSYRMTLLADNLCNIYDSVNRDMVIAGCLLHDIGKLSELETDAFGNADYTTDGKLFGHLFIGGRMLEETGLKLGTNTEIVRQLEHIILSHHGDPAIGAIAKPQTLEAYVVSEVDMMDSKIYQYEKAKYSVTEGNFSEKVFSLGNISVYNPITEG